MPYHKVLMRIIAESNLTNMEIAKRCSEIGTNLTPSYISKLTNNRMPAPSEEVSRAISKVCKVDERLLVIEGYLDKAPNEMIEAFNKMKLATSLVGLNLYKNKISEEALKELKKQILEQPIVDYIIAMLNNSDMELNFDKGIKIKENEMNVIYNFEPITIPVNDNSMSPIIMQGSRLSLELKEKYNNGDIVVIKPNNQEELLIRYMLTNNKEITLIAINKNFKPVTYSIGDISILGKVAKVITDI